MVLTAASGSYAASATILPTLTGNSRNNGSFLLAVNPSTLSIPQGASDTSKVTLFSVNGFTGTVQLFAQSQDGSLMLVLQNSTLSVPLGGTIATTLTVTVPSAAINSGHDVIVTGTGTGHRKTFSSSALLRVVVGSSANFDLDAEPSALNNIQGSSSTTIITLTSLNNFAGNITLTATIPFGFITVMGGQNPIALTANGTATTSLQITTTSSTQSGTYTIIITGTSSINTYSETVTVTVTKPVVEALVLTSRSFSPTNLTLQLQNTGDVPIILTAYTVRDSLGNAWTRTNFAGPTIPVSNSGPVSILISTSCLECTYTGIFGLFNQFVAGRTYTVILTAESGTEFTFSVTW